MKLLASSFFRVYTWAWIESLFYWPWGDPDLRQVEKISILGDIRIWLDGPDINPTKQNTDILWEYAYEGQYLGVKIDSYGLTAKNGKLLNCAMAVFVNWRYI